jgi:hypothetical protein
MDNPRDMHVRGAYGARNVLGAYHGAALEWVTVVDLRAMTFCEPSGLIAIACHVEACIARESAVLVHGPTDPGTANYVSRMRLGYWLSALGALHDLPPVREKPLGNTLLELTAFDGARGAEQLGKMVHGAVLPSSRPAADTLFDAISEAGDNVATHSGRLRGFAAAQRVDGRRTLLFAVGDCGRGMQANLEQFGATTHREALDLALKQGVTSTGDAGRGNGLSDMAQSLLEVGGSLELLSGNTRVRITGNRRYYSKPADFELQGSILQGSLPARP